MRSQNRISGLIMQQARMSRVVRGSQMRNFITPSGGRAKMHIFQPAQVFRWWGTKAAPKHQAVGSWLAGLAANASEASAIPPANARGGNLAWWSTSFSLGYPSIFRSSAAGIAVPFAHLWRTLRSNPATLFIQPGQGSSATGAPVPAASRCASMGLTSAAPRSPTETEPPPDRGTRRRL